MHRYEIIAKFKNLEAAIAALDSTVDGIGPTDWTDVTSKPSVFPPDTHAHAISDTTGLQSALDGKQASTWTDATVNFAGGTGAFEVEATIIDAGCTAQKTVEIKLAATADTDENEPEFLSPLHIIARPGAGSFIASLSATELTAGPVKLQYRLS